MIIFILGISPKKVFKKTFDKKNKKDSPFGILKDLQFN